MKKINLIIAFLIFTFSFRISTAQINTVTVGVDGFTCSLCAKGVEAQLKSLDFIKSVKTDLKNTLFVLSFKPDVKMNPKELYDAVEDGGFSVRDITIEGKGTLQGEKNTELKFVSPNSPDILLKNVPENFNSGDKISIKGKLEEDKVKVSSIKIL